VTAYTGFEDKVADLVDYTCTVYDRLPEEIVGG